jgi:hypothetical protein
MKRKPEAWKDCHVLIARETDQRKAADKAANTANKILRELCQAKETP